MQFECSKLNGVTFNYILNVGLCYTGYVQQKFNSAEVRAIKAAMSEKLQECKPRKLNEKGAETTDEKCND
jgi:hypothetical protein